MPQGKRKIQEERKARRGEKALRQIGKRIVIRYTDKPQGNHEHKPEEGK